MTTEVSSGFSKKLYKKDSKGLIRILHVYTIGGELHQESGLLDGALVKHVKECKPKNVGKSNETSPEEQAILEAKSKIEEKLTTGYFDSLDKLEEGAADVILPMLAQDYHKHSSKIDWNLPVFVQPKLDGMRALCFIKKDKLFLMSRQGKIILFMDHILRELSEIIPKDQEVILDGELYSTELDGFQENMKAIKKYTPGLTEKISYHIYDIVCQNPYKERQELLKRLFF